MSAGAGVHSLSQWRDLWRFSRFFFAQARERAWIAIALLIVASMLEGFTVLLLVPVLQSIDTVGQPVVQMPAGLAIDADLGLAPILLALVAGVGLTALVSRWRTIYLADLLFDFINTQRLSLYASISNARWLTITGLRGTDLNHLLTADIDRVQSGGANLLMLLQNLALLGIYLFVSLLVSAPMTLFAIGVGALAFAVLHPIRKQATTYGLQLTSNRQDQYRTVTDLLSGLKLIRSMNAENAFAERLKATLGRMKSDYHRFVRLNTISTMVFQLTLAIGAAAFVDVAYALLGVPLAQIVVMLFIFTRIAPRFLSLQTLVQDIFVNLPAFHAMQRTKVLCGAALDLPRPAASDARFSLDREIEFKNVNFAYGERTPLVLDTLSLTIPARKITAIIGASGAGKTTVADLLLGLLQTNSGEILIDGRPLTQARVWDWREQVAYVPQDTFLMHDTVAANLLLGAPHASPLDIEEALAAADALDFVRRLPNGLDTMIGDRGALLSGGQRQRLALARALLRRPELLLLDEGTSALDWESQALFMQSVARLRGSVTVVTIAHRLSMVAFADWVIAIEDGRVAEMGARSQLMERHDGHLSRLARNERSQGDAPTEKLQ